MADDEVGVPGPGWFPDPAGEAAYRWWDGSSWTLAVLDAHRGEDAGAVTRSGGALVRASLIVGAVLFGTWAALWALILPFLVLSDADNGRFGHDFALVWLPEVALAIVGLVMCVVFALVERGRERWRLLVWPGLVAVAIVAWSLVTLPLDGG